jgi:hypothetical protein
VLGDARGELLSGSHDGADADAAAQKLLQGAAARPTGAAQEQNVHHFLLHDFSFGYWNTSSSGTLNARAIWKAISSDGE